MGAETEDLLSLLDFELMWLSVLRRIKRFWAISTLMVTQRLVTRALSLPSPEFLDAMV